MCAESGMEQGDGGLGGIIQATNTQVLPVADFYSGLADYMRCLDPAWEEENWGVQMERERELLGSLLGRGDGAGRAN